MKNLKLEIVKKSCEVLILRLTVENEDGSKSSKDIDVSGNTGSVPVWAGTLVVNAANQLQEEFENKPEDPDYDEPCSECGK